MVTMFDLSSLEVNQVWLHLGVENTISRRNYIAFGTNIDQARLLTYRAPTEEKYHMLKWQFV